MNNSKISIYKLAFISGIFICLGMIAYFLIMKLAGFVTIPELRILNAFIVMGGCALTIRYYNNLYQKHIQYLEGLVLCFITIMVSSFLFAFFIFIYLYTIDPGLLDAIKLSAPLLGKYLTPVSAAFSIILEGICSALIISFILMQYFKDDSLHNSKSNVNNDPLMPEKE